jgi:hypothetical protein
MSTNSISVKNTICTRIVSAAVAVAQLASAPAMAQTSADETAKVLVTAVKGPELKSYRVMVAGLDAFDANHALAPRAPEVRFRLRRNNSDQSVDSNPLALRIAGTTISVTLPLAADQSFSLPRNERALSEDADLVLNKKRNNYGWDAVVNSEGVPSGMRRLGDLRLECQVLVAVGKKELNFVERALFSTVLGGTDWCRTAKFQYTTSSQRPLRSATLIVGTSRIALPLADHGMSYTTPPEGDGYTDDALIELTFTDSVRGL